MFKGRSLATIVRGKPYRGGSQNSTGEWEVRAMADWLRSIRGRLTTLCRRVKEVERCCQSIRQRLRLVEDLVRCLLEDDVDDWT